MASQANKALGLTDNLFQTTVRDFINGLRATQSAQQEKTFLKKNLADAKREVASNEVITKATALEKLVYLNMLGYDISSVEFQIVEVMSYPKVSYKCVGYRAAAAAFHKGTEVRFFYTPQRSDSIQDLTACTSADDSLGSQLAQERAYWTKRHASKSCCQLHRKYFYDRVSSNPDSRYVCHSCQRAPALAK